MNKRFTTMELVLMALLAVANAIITYYIAFLNQTLTGFFGPVGTSTIVGIYMIYGLLAMYIIRKPGAAFVTYMIGAIMQSVTGISYGWVSAVAAALCYALPIETFFYLLRYKRWSYGAMIVASISAVPIWFMVAAYLYGYLKWGIPTLLLTLAVRTLSGALLCGVLGTWLGNRLKSTGLLRPYAVGAKQPRSEQG